MKALLINRSATDYESVHTCREQGWLGLQPAAGPRHKLPLPACVSLHALRREQTQLSSAVPNSSAMTQPLAKQAHQGESKISKKVQSQALSPDSPPQTKGEAAITCRRNPASSGPLQQALCPDPILESGDGTGQRRSPSLHLALALALQLHPLPSDPCGSCQSPGEKTWPVLMLDPALPPKLLGTHRHHRDAPTQGHTFKIRAGNCFTRFYRLKLKQNKAEEYVSKEMIRKNPEKKILVKQR